MEPAVNKEGESPRLTEVRDFVHSSEMLRRMQRNTKYCEIKLEAEGEMFPVHKCLFASFSHYFDELFTNQQGNSDVVKVEGVKSDSLRLIVDFVYTGQLWLNTKCALELLDAAELLKIPKIVKHSTGYLVDFLSVENCFEIYRYGVKYNIAELIRCSTALIGNNLKTVCGYQHFLSLDVHEFEKILAKRRKTAENDEGAYVATVVWVKHDCDVRQEHFTRLFANIDVKLFSESFLKEVVLHEQLVRSSVECLNIVVDELTTRVDKSTLSVDDKECLESHGNQHNCPQNNSNRPLSPHRMPPPPPKQDHNGRGSPPELSSKPQQNIPKIQMVHPLPPAPGDAKPIPMRPRNRNPTTHNLDPNHDDVTARQRSTSSPVQQQGKPHFPASPVKGLLNRFM